ncbi:MAG: hypothetical protein MZU84_04800 [Sphingobacterium sp.]|nr:hypothetical protein [Sphingobacterium sp.]
MPKLQPGAASAVDPGERRRDACAATRRRWQALGAGAVEAIRRSGGPRRRAVHPPGARRAVAAVRRRPRRSPASASHHPMNARLFGTDGVRGRAGAPPLDTRTVRRLGMALVKALPRSAGRDPAAGGTRHARVGRAHRARSGRRGGGGRGRRSSARASSRRRPWRT